MPNTGTSSDIGAKLARQLAGQQPAPGGVAEHGVADRLPDHGRPGQGIGCERRPRTIAGQPSSHSDMRKSGGIENRLAQTT